MTDKEEDWMDRFYTPDEVAEMLSSNYRTKLLKMKGGQTWLMEHPTRINAIKIYDYLYSAQYNNKGRRIFHSQLDIKKATGIKDVACRTVIFLLSMMRKNLIDVKIRKRFFNGDRRPSLDYHIGLKSR